MKKQILKWSRILVFALVLVLPLQVNAEEPGAGTDTDEEPEIVTVKDVRVSLNIPTAEANKVSSFQFTLNVPKNADGELVFEFDDSLEEKAEVTEYRYSPETGKMNIYVSSAESLFTEGQHLEVGTIGLTDRNTVVSGDAKSLKYVSGSVLKETSAGGVPGELVVAADYYYEDISPYREGGEYTYPRREGKVFAGWYKDETFNTPLSSKTVSGGAYAKFVDEGVLTVRYQTADNTSKKGYKDLRMITSVDSLNYQCVGFDIYIDGSHYGERTTTKAYTTITDMGGKSVTLENFPEESCRMMTYLLSKIPSSYSEKEFEVTPYWITQDGTTVRGTTAAFKVWE